MNSNIRWNKQTFVCNLNCAINDMQMCAVISIVEKINGIHIREEYLHMFPVLVL